MQPAELLWGTRRTRARAVAQLSAERIADAAIGLADSGGLAAVSMARVAERSGAATMSLYRHVRNKDELVALMVETALAESPQAPSAGEGWRPALERWAHDLLEVVQRHPWVLDLPLARMPIGPRRAAWLDRGLATFAETRLGEREKAALVLLVNDYVFSHARLDAQFAGEATPSANALLSDVVDAGTYPALRKALDAGVFAGTGRGRDASFAFGLARILDGIERLA